MRKAVTAAALLLTIAAGCIAAQAQQTGGATVGDASAAFRQLEADRNGTVSQQIMHAPAGDVLAIYIGRAPRQVYGKQDELLYVISGHGTAALGYPSFPVKPGSVISIPRSTAFTISASGGAPIKAILIASPHYDPGDKRILEQ